MATKACISRRMKPCLLYVDDALFFVKQEIQEIQVLMIMFLTFANSLGLSVSMAKSELLVQGSEHPIYHLLQIMVCRGGQFPFTYLAVPWHGLLGSQRKIHLVNCSLVCTSKKLGGLGVLDLKDLIK